MMTGGAAGAEGASAPPDALPGCGFGPAEPEAQPVGPAAWQVVLDTDGVVVAHELDLPGERDVRVGPAAFHLVLADGRVLVGERSAEATELTLVDPSRSCLAWRRTVDRLLYPVAGTDPDGGIRLRVAEPVTRLVEGVLVLAPETGASTALIDEACLADCQPNDGDVEGAAFMPVGASRPVPVFAGGAWPAGTQLPFRWQPGAVPPDWAKDPLKAAAADASTTSAARSPDFTFRRGAANGVRYTAVFPSFCASGIACAQRIMATGFWTTWIRPHGTDYVWGTLRWCQKRDRSGCFDVRRVMLHELGHISGLNHPESAGTRLPAHDTVMHAITPAKPRQGSAKRRFGDCDVASLQELYDVPGRRTRISRCNDVQTRIRLWADASTIVRGASVRLKAELSIADRAAYGRLARNLLDGRSVKLRYRRAGSDDAWATAWLKEKKAAGRYGITLQPTETWEYRAVFPAPDDEGLRFSRSETMKVKVTDA